MYDARLRRWGPFANFAAFAALIFTFLLINLLPKISSSLHGYAS
jgi:hypothetical protein